MSIATELAAVKAAQRAPSEVLRLRGRLQNLRDVTGEALAEAETIVASGALDDLPAATKNALVGIRAAAVALHETMTTGAAAEVLAPLGD